MKQADPIDINSTDRVGGLSIENPTNFQLIIAYEDDTTEIMKFHKARDYKGLLKYIQRGYKFDPAIDGDEYITKL
jgi:hypothetical protein